MRLVKLGIANVNPTVGAVRSNVDRCIELAKALAAERTTLAVFPEQVVGGYAMEDLVQWRAFHLGVAGSWFSPGDTHTVQIRSRPEARVGADRLVDTGAVDASDVNRYGLEGAGVYGPFSLQAEYLRGDVHREDAGNPDVDFDGWYVMGSWVMTGESRRYDAPKERGGRW